MEYRAATTVIEALQLLAQGKGVQLVAGGTDLALAVADDLIRPSLLVDITGIPALRGIHSEEENIRIGAATTIAEIAASTEVPFCLAQGARSIGSPQVRNLGTIGGNICNASPCGDTLTPLISLGSVFVVASGAGRREIPSEKFFVAPKKTVLESGELLEEIRIDREHLGGRSSFRMIGKREGPSISQVNLAVWLSVRDGNIQDVRLAAGSVAPVPLRLRATEKLLRGQEVSGLDIAAARDAMARELAPISDVRGSAAYRTAVADSLLAELLEEVLRG